MGDWQPWIGRQEERDDVLTPALVARWCATLDRAFPAGDAAPQGLHWCLATPDAATASLGPDGHPRRDDPASLLPPIPLPRRMWAASKLRFHAPLRVGEKVRRVSRVASISEKTGASGALAFVEIAHETFGAAGLAVSEVQTLVYREASPAGAPPAPPVLGADKFDAGGWQWCRRVTPSPALLFRYSALTFNSHRIHYDAPYACGAENYRGLMVHGPLMATLLLDLARRELGENALTHFAFRALSPAIAGEELVLVGRRADAGYEFGAFAGDGRQVVAASGG